MIISIKQTSSNIRQKYDIESDNFHFKGELGNLFRFQPITVSNADTEIKGIHKISKLKNYIPFRYLFGKTNKTRMFYLYCDGVKYGSISFLREGLLKTRHIISTDKTTFYCYIYAKGSFEYVSIYQDEKQVALIETHLAAIDFKYTHKLYILDGYEQYAETFSLFVLYYANYNSVSRYHMSRGSVSEKAWTISKYNNKFDPKWHETHFPDDNYWGTI